MLDILFICHGNICRSPGGVRDERPYGEAGGLPENFRSPPPPPAARSLATIFIPNPARPGTGRHPLFLPSGTPNHESDYEAYDYIIAMDRANMRNLERLLGGDPEGKFFLSWNLPENTGISPTPGIREILTKPTGTSNRAVQLCWNFYCNNINYKTGRKDEVPCCSATPTAPPAKKAQAWLESKGNTATSKQTHPPRRSFAAGRA